MSIFSWFKRRKADDGSSLAGAALTDAAIGLDSVETAAEVADMAGSDSADAADNDFDGDFD